MIGNYIKYVHTIKNILFYITIGYKANQPCNCSDESVILNCGNNITTGEIFSGESSNITTKKQYNSVTCITTDAMEPLLYYDITIIIGSNINSTFLNKLNENEKDEDSESVLSNLNDNIMLIDVGNIDNDFKIFATYAKGKIFVII